MGFTQSVKTCFSKYVVFSGRARRSEYWWFVLFVIAVSIGLSILGSLLFGSDPETGQGSTALNKIFQLAVFLPMLAAGWRRLHDTGRPGWYLLLPVALSIGTTILLMTGVVVFSALETGVDDPETLKGPASVLGLAGIAIVTVIQLVISVLMIWWLSRPSQDGTNEYGPPASA